MSLPPINPDKSAAGISVDPATLQRVIAPTKRADGSVRKEIKIRPGYTPQEDVSIFKGTKQVQAEARKQGKANVPGWAPATSTAKPGAAGSAAGGQSKSAKKNAKRKEKKQADVEAKIKDSWEDDDEDEVPAPTKGKEKKDAEVDGLTDKLGETKIANEETS